MSRHQSNMALLWFCLESACVVSIFACVTASFSGVSFFFMHACQSSGKMVSSRELFTSLIAGPVLAALFLDVAPGLHAHPPSSVTGHLSLNQGHQEQILVDVKYGHIYSKYPQISSMF